MPSLSIFDLSERLVCNSYRLNRLPLSVLR